MSCDVTESARRATISGRTRLHCRPHRARRRPPVAVPIRTGNSSFRCAATAASTADLGEANAAHTPSPVCLNSQPPCASIALRNTSSWAASASRIASASVGGISPGPRRCHDGGHSVPLLIPGFGHHGAALKLAKHGEPDSAVKNITSSAIKVIWTSIILVVIAGVIAASTNWANGGRLLYGKPV
jgi:hypothetical protein